MVGREWLKEERNLNKYLKTEKSMKQTDILDPGKISAVLCSKLGLEKPYWEIVNIQLTPIDGRVVSLGAALDALREPLSEKGLKISGKPVY